MKALFNMLMCKESVRAKQSTVHPGQFGHPLHLSQVSTQWLQDPVLQNTSLGTLPYREEKKSCPEVV